MELAASHAICHHLELGTQKDNDSIQIANQCAELVALLIFIFQGENGQLGGNF